MRCAKIRTQPLFGTDEHLFLGDTLKLTGRDGKQMPAGAKLAALPNTLSLSYGEINGLAGDYYGTYEPVSDATRSDEQKRRFIAAFATLGYDKSRQPGEAQHILGLVMPRIKGSKVSFLDLRLELATLFRSLSMPGYLGISLINWDHFGSNARVAYSAGHELALAEAQKGNLDLAYAINAFADHYLEDSFSAGHVRTPRRHLHGRINIIYDRLAEYMHDEDGAIGLSVRNKRGDQWTMFGDDHLKDPADNRNLALCLEALGRSVGEVYAAFTGHMPDHFEALDLLPDMDAAENGQELAALFKLENGKLLRRVDVADRRKAEYTHNWTSFGTLFAIWWSGRWKLPIKLESRG